MKAINQIFQQDFIKIPIEHFKRFVVSFGFYEKKTRQRLLWLLKSNYLLLLTLFLMFAIPFFLRIVIFQVNFAMHKLAEPNLEEIAIQQEIIRKETKILEKKLAAKTPRSFYLVINSSSNEFTLYKGLQPIKTDKCSTGSYILLKNGDQQQWMFKTPKGEFRIHGKATSPIWKKPDWAFIEEGLPVPSLNHHSRFEAGVLGDYALSLGDGYLIHGTLYQRFLGLPVTHGCIRLNDENLDLVYRSLSGGSKVYIY